MELINNAPIILAQIGQKIDMVGTDQNANLVSTTIPSIINYIIGALAIVAVVVMIIGGITYMTSSGDAGKVKKAKDTILYGVIGLVVCALAYAIVNWVIGGLLGGGSSGGGSDDRDKAAMTECIKAKGEWKDGACVYKDGSSTK